MHIQSERALRQLACDCLNEYDIDAFAIYVMETNAQYAAEDDGDRDDYNKRADEIFNEEKLHAFADPDGVAEAASADLAVVS